MTVSIGQAAGAESSTSVTIGTNFASALAENDLLWVGVLTESLVTPGVTYLINGVDPGPPYFTDVATAAGMVFQQSFWNCAGGEQFVRITVDAPYPTTLLLVSIVDDAHLPPYDAEYRVGVGPAAPMTPSVFCPDSGVVLGFAAMPGTKNITEPAGWTFLGALAPPDDTLSCVLAWDTVGGGVLASQAWTGDVPDTDDQSLSTIIPFQDVARRLPPAVGFASNPGGMLLGAGRVEPPNKVEPFIEDTNPLPSLPSDIEVPLPPWVPQPGPWRKDS